jgi:hypothetical protein
MMLDTLSMTGISINKAGREFEMGRSLGVIARLFMVMGKRYEEKMKCKGIDCSQRELFPF